jgi:UDP-glucose:tetrahydrobiopterin glucosyltransferase
MMNILLVTGPGISLKEPYDSGIESFIVSFANQLVEEGHSVSIVAEEAAADAKFTLVNPFTDYQANKPFSGRRTKEMRQFRNLDVDAYDVVHYNMFYPHLLKAGLHFHQPSFLTLHSPADNKRISAYQEISKQTELTFVAVSDRVKREWEKGLGIDIPLINNGIDIGLWPTKNPGNRKYLLWAARINELKNVAAAISVAQHMQLPLKIAGRIADQHYFETQVKPHLNSQIVYAGHVTQRELSGLADHASAYLATATWQEPFGLATLEMLASGLPVVGFDTAVPPDWKHESILITASHNWEDLPELVEKSTTISPETCKAFALNMSIQQMTSNYLKLYQEILLRKGTAADLSTADR